MAGKPKWNVASPIAYGDDKTYWQNVGSAWENTEGKGKHDVVINLNSLPLADKDGKVRIFLFPKDDDRDNSRGRDDSRSSSGKSKPKGSSRKNDYDDEIPF